jgi:hypothetical protein
MGFILESGLGQDHNGETITVDTTWFAKDNPHNITGTVYVVLAKNLTINPGAIIKFNASSGPGGITVDNDGNLFALGSSAEPILFTSNESSPSMGDWSKILFGTKGKDGCFQNCQIHYPTTGLEIQNGNVLVEDTLITNSSTGIWVKGGNAEIYNTSIIDSDKGIRVDGATPIIDNVTLENCNRGFWLESSLNITNSTIINSSNENFYLSNLAVVKTINCTYNNNNKVTGGSTLVKQWYVHLYVTDTLDHPLEDVNITIKPNGQAPIYYKTDATGWRRWVVCTELENTASGITYITPYNITVQKAGYNSTMIQRNITNSSTFHLMLKDTIKPTSELDDIPEYWYNTPSVQVDYTANDNSYIEDVSLYYEYSIDNQSFSNAKKIKTNDVIGDQTSAAGAFDFKFDEGEGHYHLFTLASDKSGNPQHIDSKVMQKLALDITPPEFTDIEVSDITEDSETVCRVTLTIKEELSGLARVPRISYMFDSTDASWSMADLQMNELTRGHAPTRNYDVDYYFDIPVPSQGWEHYQDKSILWEVTCFDFAGNTNITSVLEKIDLINYAPEIDFITPAQDSWYSGTINIQTSPNDDLDENDPVTEWGIASVIAQYSIDSTIDGHDGTWSDCTESPITTEPFNVDWDSTGIATNNNVWLRVKCIDNGGLASPWSSVRIKIDNEAPNTIINDYLEVWHNTDFQINLTADDGFGSGVEEIYYRLNNGTINSMQDDQPIINSEGANNTLEYWSLDDQGNEELHKFLTGIKLDKTKPNITNIEISKITINTLLNSEVVLSLNASDSLSGLKHPPQYRLQVAGANLSDWENMDVDTGDRYQVVLNSTEIDWASFDSGELIFEVRCTDNANNSVSTRWSEVIDNFILPSIDILHMPVTQGYVNKPITINATVIARNAPDIMLAYYQPVDGKSFESIQMTLTGQIYNTINRNESQYKYSIELPGQTKPGNIYYYFSANYTIFTINLPTVNPEKNAFAIMIKQIKTDVDEKELPDWWLEQYFGNISEYIEADDPDGDGLSNLQEYENGTDPTNNDTDNDGLPDNWELEHEINPNDPAGKNGPNGDFDGDGISNLDEYKEDIKPDDDTRKSTQEESKSGVQSSVYIAIIMIMIVIIALLSFTTFRRRKTEKQNPGEESEDDLTNSEFEDMEGDIGSDIDSEELDLEMDVEETEDSDIPEDDMYYDESIPPETFGSADDITSELSLDEVEPAEEYEAQIMEEDGIVDEGVDTKPELEAELALDDDLGADRKADGEPVESLEASEPGAVDVPEGDESPEERLLKKFEELKKKLNDGNNY